MVLLFFSTGILPSIHTFTFCRKFPNIGLFGSPQVPEVTKPGNVALATSNNVVSRGEQSTKCSRPLESRILYGLTTQLLRLVTPPLLVVQLRTLLQDQGEPSFHQGHDLDRHRHHFCSFENISPTVQLLAFSARVISHTGPYARSSERRHELKLFGQLSDTPVVVQNLIDFVQIHVLQLLKHIEFQTTIVTDCIRQTSVVSTWQPQCSTSSSIDASGNSCSFKCN